MSAKKTDREKLNEQLLELVEKNGFLPWQKPWICGYDVDSFSANVTKKKGQKAKVEKNKKYSGANAMILPMFGYTQNIWVGIGAIKKNGIRINKGEKCSYVYFFKIWETEDEKTGEIKKIPILKSFPVFNVEQLDENTFEYEKIVVEKVQIKEFNKIENAEKIIDGYVDRPQIREANKAFYAPVSDVVGMPKKELFSTEQEYYHTLFHELAHSTGSEKRLDRGFDKNVVFGDSDYSKEELVAEISAYHLSNKAGFRDVIEGNSAAYLKSWLKQLKNNKNWFYWATKKAQECIEYITK